MRAVVQRVRSAKVTVDDHVVGRIGSGLLVFVGVADEGDTADTEYTASKILGLRPRTVETGVFGALTSVELTNDGPVTILIDSRRLF